MFKTNESMTDRIIRVVIGVVMIAIFFLFPGLLGAWNWLWWIGIVPLATRPDRLVCPVPGVRHLDQQGRIGALHLY